MYPEKRAFFWKALFLTELAVSFVVCHRLCLALMRMGFVRDEYNWIGNDPGLLLWFGLIGLLLLWGAAALGLRALRRQGGTARLIAPALFNAAVLAGCCLLLIRVDLRYDEIEGLRSPPTQPIALEQLRDLAQAQTTGILVIGREDCGFCVEAYPNIEQTVAQYDLHLLKYDTGLDRIERAEEMGAVLQQLGVEVVPAVLVVQDGAVAHLFQGERAAYDLKEFCRRQIRVGRSFN